MLGPELPASGKTCPEAGSHAYLKKEKGKEEYPAIAQLAQEENAAIYWADETGTSNCENYERGFSPKGQPPILPVETKKERVNIISALSSYGEVRNMLYENSMNQQHLISFMQNMLKTST